MRLSWIIGVSLVLASATAGAAAQPDAAYGAYQRGLYQTAFREATLRL